MNKNRVRPNTLKAGQIIYRVWRGQIAVFKILQKPRLMRSLDNFRSYKDGYLRHQLGVRIQHLGYLVNGVPDRAWDDPCHQKPKYVNDLCVHHCAFHSKKAALKEQAFQQRYDMRSTDYNCKGRETFSARFNRMLDESDDCMDSHEYDDGMDSHKYDDYAEFEEMIESYDNADTREEAEPLDDGYLEGEREYLTREAEKTGGTYPN